MPTQIDAWLDRHFPLPKRFKAGNPADIYDGHWLVWMGVEEQMCLHEVRKADWLSLREHRARAMKYVADAIKILGSDQVEEEDDKKMVIDHLGVPPEPARPLYVVTTKENGKGRLLTSVRLLRVIAFREDIV